MHGANVLPERTSDKGTVRYYYIAYPYCAEFYPLLAPVHRKLRIFFWAAWQKPGLAVMINYESNL